MIARHLIRVGAVALAAVVIADCGGGGGSDTSGGSPATGAGAAHAGGTLRIALSKPAGNLDPHKYIGVWGVQSLIFDPLVVYGDGGKIGPGLAKSWEISSDGRRYTFHLRPRVRFSDGTAFDAKALDWNFKRWIGLPDNSFLGVSQNFRRGRVIDRLTYELDLKRPYPPALQELAYIRPVRMLSPASVDARGRYRKPVGTGPWMLSSDSSQQTAVVRNPDYWGRKPLLDRIELKVITDDQGRLSGLRAGDVDVIGGDNTAPMTPRDALTLSAASDVTVVDEPGAQTLVLAFNEDRQPLSDVSVRRAVSLAIDRKVVSKVIYAGKAPAASSLFPPSVPFSGPPQQVTPPDPALARQTLDAAGWADRGGVREKDGKKLAMTLVASEEALPGARELAELVQQQLKAIGVQISIRLLDHASSHDEIPNREYDLTFLPTFGAPYDPFSSFTDLFDSRIDSGADGKIFTSPRFDRLIDAALAAASDEDRTKAYDAAYEFLRREYAFVPLIYTPRLWAHRDDVQGFALPSTEYELPWSGVSLSGSA